MFFYSNSISLTTPTDRIIIITSVNVTYCHLFFSDNVSGNYP